MVKKILNIIKGNWRNLIRFKSDISEKRKQICKTCEHNIKFMGTRICDQCGCIIDAKVTIENEQCNLNKW